MFDVTKLVRINFKVKSSPHTVKKDKSKRRERSVFFFFRVIPVNTNCQKSKQIGIADKIDLLLQYYIY